MSEYLPLQRQRETSLDLGRVTTVLFDLDGTLIDVDMQRFIPAYLHRLTARLNDLAESRRVARTIWQAVEEMLHVSDGHKTMEQVLLDRLQSTCGIDAAAYRQRLALFLAHDLAELQPLVTPHPLAHDLVRTCLDHGWQPVLATNPIFPAAAVEARLLWGGLAGLPFRLVSAYEEFRHCKPHNGYFQQLLAALGSRAEACLMVGNDTEHDLSAGELGMQTCLLTTWQIDRGQGRYRPDWQGEHAELLQLLHRHR
ncbi:MAG: HAD family hydrolase [Desulfuromonadales bacterium]|nr:HAD family hydrolase [Desulfuromonadales bacterium]